MIEQVLETPTEETPVKDATPNSEIAEERCGPGPCNSCTMCTGFQQSSDPNNFNCVTPGCGHPYSAHA